MKGMASLDIRTVAAIQRLQSPELEPVLSLLKNLAIETDTALRRAKPDTFGQLQGRAMFLEEFLTVVANAATTLEKLRPK